MKEILGLIVFDTEGVSYRQGGTNGLSNNLMSVTQGLALVDGFDLTSILPLLSQNKVILVIEAE